MLNIIRNGLEEKSLRKQLSKKVSALDKLVTEHSKLESRHHFLERELEMAARVQQSLLPDHFPALDGFRFANLYRPCEALGGDFYDFALDGERATIIVSDVIGHGVQAALTTMLLKGIFQEAATDAREPVALLTEMNGRLHRIMPEGMYVAASVLSLDQAGSTLHFANAGLPYPFVLRGSEKRLDEIALAGPPLGLFGEGPLIDYEARSTNLERGDVFLVGSDGLGSVTGAGDELFEDHELRKVLTELAGTAGTGVIDGQKVIEKLMEKAEAFGGNRPLPDDVNVLAITRSGPT